MVGFISQDDTFPSNPSATKDNESELSPSYIDSYLDFDFIKNLLVEEEAPCLNSAGEKVEFLEFEELMDMVDTEKEARANNDSALGFDNSSSVGLSQIDTAKEENLDECATSLNPGCDLEVKVDKVEAPEPSNSNVCIEDKMEEVSLNSAGEKVEFLEFEELMDMVYTEKEARANNDSALGFDNSSSLGLSQIDTAKEENLDECATSLNPGCDLEVKVDKVEAPEPSNSNVCIEDKMEKVSLNSAGEKVEFLEFEELMDMVDTEKEARANNDSAFGFDNSSSVGLSPIDTAKEEKLDECATSLNPGCDLEVKVDKVEAPEPSNSNVCIEEKMEKVSLLGEETDGKEIGEESDEDVSGNSSDSESENESSSSESSLSASSSSEDDDNEGKGNEAEQVEEGEIVDSTVVKMVSWSDDEEEDEDVGVPKGPIRSKNELKDLPLVPRVDVTLQPHHQTLPVGLILSIVGAQVIVEGTEKHSPLNEGSILWITESRAPLGLVDEIFGPVKNPYYVVRYNSEDEVPGDIQVSTPISYVPEFVNHVLNDSSLYKKGYDASNENDEELSDEVEFSDDEKEAEYRRMKKESKRGKNEGLGKRKKDKRKTQKQDGNWTDIHSKDQQQTPVGFGNSSLSSGSGQGFPGDPSLMQPLDQATNPMGVMTIANGSWPMLGQQMQQNMVFPNVFHANGMPWMQQNPQQQQYQMPLPQGMPFQQQFGPNQMLLHNVVMPCGQPNFVPGSANQPWMGFMANNGGFMQASPGLGLQGQQFQQFMSMQGVSSTHASSMEQDSGMQSQSFNVGNNITPQFSRGNSFGRGNRPQFNRGRRGRFAGGRGRHQRN